MSEANLPCPFCGAEVDPDGWLDVYGVGGPECSNCGATSYDLEAWNTRPRYDRLKSELDATIDILEQTRRERDELRKELLHCSVFIRTREKMHPIGVELFDELLEKTAPQEGSDGR